MLLTETITRQATLRTIMLHIPVYLNSNLARGFISRAPRDRAVQVVIISSKLRIDRIMSRMTNVLMTQQLSVHQSATLTLLQLFDR